MLELHAKQNAFVSTAALLDLLIKGDNHSNHIHNVQEKPRRPLERHGN
jgi:hypothetical protein